MRKCEFSLEAVAKLVTGGDLSEDSEDWLFAVGEVHDFLLSDVPSNTAMRHLIAARSALMQTEAAPLGETTVWLLPANEWEIARLSKRVRPE
jgi:hypothetical protein